MMEHPSENNSGQGNRPAATSLGNILREAREKLGLSVADVAGQIKFAPRQIEALEAEDFKRLPEAAFLRGFVRSYAKILHLDAE
jgi:cytoskeleton protein RodZ